MYDEILKCVEKINCLIICVAFETTLSELETRLGVTLGKFLNMVNINLSFFISKENCNTTLQIFGKTTWNNASRVLSTLIGRLKSVSYSQQCTFKCIDNMSCFHHFNGYHSLSPKADIFNNYMGTANVKSGYSGTNDHPNNFPFYCSLLIHVPLLKLCRVNHNLFLSYSKYAYLFPNHSNIKAAKEV